MEMPVSILFWRYMTITLKLRKLIEISIELPPNKKDEWETIVAYMYSHLSIHFNHLCIFYLPWIIVIVR